LGITSLWVYFVVFTIAQPSGEKQYDSYQTIAKFSHKMKYHVKIGMIIANKPIKQADFSTFQKYMRE